ncbi:DoxX family protein [Caenimonas koreensis]|uniref:DoxX family membrane protein n=1 Tax=Caenimonas koreensis DSM 17982 TaxID=1121255 RepID=A0A844AVT8_9BURK|nr:DoxX family protein [Caenimonas koreensis]MRD48204.1 DoxX family membrane protein [Caenimonas koreensis DSM 17982]
MNTRLAQALAYPLQWWQYLCAALDSLQPLAALAARAYVGHAFFLSGLTKIRDWDTTLALFADEYKVPLLPPALAAPLGTAGELVLPVLLVLGLGGRFAALGLSVVNIVAVLSLQEVLPVALQQHTLWGSLLAGIAIFGPGAWSLERIVWPRIKNFLQPVV